MLTTYNVGTFNNRLNDTFLKTSCLHVRAINTPLYTPFLYSEIGVYMGIPYLPIFALKHRSWVLVSASLRQF